MPTIKPEQRLTVESESGERREIIGCGIYEMRPQPNGPAREFRNRLGVLRLEDGTEVITSDEETVQLDGVSFRIVDSKPY